MKLLSGDCSRYQAIDVVMFQNDANDVFNASTSGDCPRDHVAFSWVMSIETRRVSYVYDKKWFDAVAMVSHLL